MTWASRRTPKTTPSTLTPTIRRYAASSMRAISRSPVVTPALRQASSTGPTSSHARGSVTSKPSTTSSTCTAVPSRSSAATIAAPIPERPPVTSALRNEDNLPHVLALLHQPVRRGGIGQGKGRADNRSDGARGPQRHQLPGRRLHDLGRKAHQPAKVEADERDVAPDEERRVYRLPPAAGEPEQHVGAQRSEDFVTGGH